MLWILVRGMQCLPQGHPEFWEENPSSTMHTLCQFQASSASCWIQAIMWDSLHDVRFKPSAACMSIQTISCWTVAWFKPIILAGLFDQARILCRAHAGSQLWPFEFMAGAASSAAPSDSEVDSSPGFKIESHWAIVHKLDTWYPEVVTRNGDNFIKLSKFDWKFVLFALGQPMDLSKGVARSANSLLFDKLLELRKRASEESARQQMEMPESQDNPADPSVPKRRSKRVRVEDGCLVDPRVEIQLPELETKNEFFLSRPAMGCHVKGAMARAQWI